MTELENQLRNLPVGQSVQIGSFTVTRIGNAAYKTNYRAGEYRW